MATIESSATMRSGLPSFGRSKSPPRAVRRLAFAPPSPTTGVSPNAFVGPTAIASLSWTSMPSSDSQKSSPSLAGSNVPLVSTSPLASSSMTVLGGMRPPVPTTIGAGKRLPRETTAIVGPESSVVVRLPEDAPPGRNSWTFPLTVTASPTLTVVGELLVNTKIPSLVAGSESGFGSCM